MKNKHRRCTSNFHCIILFLAVAIFNACEKYPVGPSEEYGELTGAYLGELLPDTIPVRFCPDFFSEELHTPPIFSPNGQEIYFKPMNSVGYPKIFEMRMEQGVWSEPRHASFNFNCMNDAPFITSDGERLYFLSTADASYTTFHESIYYATRMGDDWSEPVKISDEVNDFTLHWQFSLAENYNLYFKDADEGDLYYSEYIEGSYQKPEKLPGEINTADQNEGSPFIAPDESYIIFDRAEGTDTDLYISFREGEKMWTEAIPISPAINTEADELYGYVTSDEKHLFFLRMTDEGLFPFWVDASVIENLRK